MKLIIFFKMILTVVELILSCLIALNAFNISKILGCIISAVCIIFDLSLLKELGNNIKEIKK